MPKRGKRLPFRFRTGVSNASITPDGKSIICAVDGELLKIDPVTRKTVSKFPLNKGYVCATKPDSSQVAILSADGKQMDIHELATGKRVKGFAFAAKPWGPMIFTPGGRYLLVLERPFGLRIWDTVEGKLARKLEIDAFAMQISPDGKYLLFRVNENLQLYDFATLKKIHEIPPPFSRFDAGVFSADSSMIIATWGGQLAAFDRATGKKVFDYNAKGSSQHTIWASRDNQFVLMQSIFGKNFYVFRVGQPGSRATSFAMNFATMAHPGRCVEIQNGEELILRCSKDDPAFRGTGELAKVDDPLSKVPSGMVADKFGTKLSGYGAVAFSTNGKYLVSASKNEKIRVYETATSKRVNKIFPTEFDLVSGVAMSADEFIYIIGTTGMATPGVLFNNPTYISKINLATGKEERFTGISGAFSQLQLAPDDSRLYFVGRDFSVRVMDAKSGRSLHAWENLYRVPRAFRIAPDGKSALMAMESGPIVLNLDNYREGLKIPEKIGLRGTVCLLGDGSRAAMIVNDITLKIYDLKTGNLIKSADLADRDSRDRFTIACGSPDGKHVYIGGTLKNDDLLRVVDVSTCKVVYRYCRRKGGTFAGVHGNLMAFRNQDELFLVALPPLPK